MIARKIISMSRLTYIGYLVFHLTILTLILVDIDLFLCLISAVGTGICILYFRLYLLKMRLNEYPSFSRSCVLNIFTIGLGSAIFFTGQTLPLIYFGERFNKFSFILILMMSAGLGASLISMLGILLGAYFIKRE